MARELGKDNIRVNGIAPGLIETKFGNIVSEYMIDIIAAHNSDITQQFALKMIANDGIRDDVMEFTPMGRYTCDRKNKTKQLFVLLYKLYRIGQPDECAGVVSFLCSDDASYITGETIVIAGGMQSRL